MRILLVENDELLGECIRCGLSYYRYDVEWIKDGSEAWRVLQTKYFDMVILDFDLLESSCEEVLKNMRLNGITTPAIIMSSNCDIHNCVKWLDVGYDYVSKPFEIEKLCARIRVVHKRTAQKRGGRTG
ncbi:hypothetical protein GAMM_50007 [Gammaproteobacteria bacterium]